MDKPHITFKGSGRFSVRFPCGGTAEVFKVEGSGHLPDWRWQAVSADGKESSGRPSMTSDHAFRAAWCFVRPAPEALKGYDAEYCRAAEDMRCKEYTKLLRKMLKERTGRTWSVKVGSGTGYSWLTINAPPARIVDWKMSPDDESLLASVLGEDSIGQYHQIPPTSGYRAWNMARVAGLDTEGFALQEHSWANN